MRAHVVHAPPEDLVDEVLLAAEVVVDRGDVDVGTAGDLAQRGAAEAELGEQFLGGAEDAVLGGKVGGGSHGRPSGVGRPQGRLIKRLFDATTGRRLPSTRDRKDWRNECAEALQKRMTIR